MTSGKRLLAKVAPYASMARGISNEYRLAILYLLAHDPMWPQDIARHLPIPQNLVAHHLKAMVTSGWLKKKREGKYTMYSINKKVFRQLPQLLIDTPLWREIQK
jgi:predicted transcriptional regulator